MPESKEIIHRVQNPIAENRLLASREVGPLLGLLGSLYRWHDLCDQLVALPEFDCFPGAQPGLQAASIT